MSCWFSISFVSHALIILIKNRDPEGFTDCKRKGYACGLSNCLCKEKMSMDMQAVPKFGYMQYMFVEALLLSNCEQQYKVGRIHQSFVVALINKTVKSPLALA